MAGGCRNLNALIESEVGQVDVAPDGSPAGIGGDFYSAGVDQSRRAGSLCVIESVFDAS